MTNLISLDRKRARKTGSGEEAPLSLFLAFFRLGPRGATRTAIFEALDLEHAGDRFASWYPWHYEREDPVLIELKALPRLSYIELSTARWSVSALPGEDGGNEEV